MSPLIFTNKNMTANSGGKCRRYGFSEDGCNVYTSNKLFSYLDRVIVIEAASACKLLLQMCKLLSFHNARETRRDETTSTAAERRIDEFVGRVSATLQHHLPARFKPYLGIDPNFGRHILIQNFIQLGVKFVPDAAATKISYPIV